MSRTRRKRPELTEDEIKKSRQIRVCYESTGLSREQFLRLARIATQERGPGRPPEADVFKLLCAVDLQRRARLRGEELSDWAAVGIVADLFREDKENLRRRLIDMRTPAQPTLESLAKPVEQKGFAVSHPMHFRLISSWPQRSIGSGDKGGGSCERFRHGGNYK